MNFLRKLFESDFMPHGHCYFWKPEVLWTNVIGDGITALAYFIIPFGLYYYSTRKPNLAFKGVFILFAMFILSCGTTHILDIISVWHPIYRFEGALKIFTGIVSLITAGVLLKIIPDALMLPSITELKNLYKNLAKQNNALQQVAYATSHSMKEPIRGLTIYAQRVKAKYGDVLPDEAKADLDYMASEGNRMYNLIESLMDYAFITPENFKLSKVELADVLLISETGLKLNIEEERATIEYGDLPAIRGNKDLLVLLFQKLISNSIRFRGVRQPKIIVKGRVEGSDVIIDYSDNSIGFSEEYKEKVFEMFVKVHEGTDIRSSGLGLAITRRIVELHHGAITIESNFGEGVRFTIRFAKM